MILVFGLTGESLSFLDLWQMSKYFAKHWHRRLAKVRLDVRTDRYSAVFQSAANQRHNLVTDCIHCKMHAYIRNLAGACCGKPKWY